jgi:antitoxin ParD1/3/4
VSEYIRDLVRRDYESEEARRWDSLHGTLKAGIEAPESAFAALKTEDILREARKTKRADG